MQDENREDENREDKKLPEYEIPQVITYTDEEILENLGPAQSQQYLDVMRCW